MRNQTTVLTTLALAMAIGLPAAAQNPASTPTSQPATVPSEDQSTSQAPSSSTAPSTSTSPSTSTQSPQDQSPSSGVQAAPPARTQAPRDPVAEALNLTDDQQAKLQPIIQEEMSQINAVRNDTTLSAEQKQQKVDQIRQTQFPKIQAILTPDQRKKLAEMQEQARQKANQGAPANQTNPQPPPQ